MRFALALFHSLFHMLPPQIEPPADCYSKPYASDPPVFEDMHRDPCRLLKTLYIGPAPMHYLASHRSVLKNIYSMEVHGVALQYRCEACITVIRRYRYVQLKSLGAR